MVTYRIPIFAVALAIAGCMGPPKAETDVSKYSSILSDWKPSGLVDHFPSAVPTTATNVRFSSFPGYMQGGAHIQLGMTSPTADLKKLYDDASRKAKQYHDGGDSMALVNSRDDGLAGPSPRTLAAGTPEFPEDYRIFIFDAESTSHWNHGKSKGVVISLQRNEVIYFAENW